ncbi:MULTISPECIES: hypothetical protein [Mycolicibacterium]|uniref:hypothetical protein n=1 Tax=Mycolicibacterium TaxID=1866885 RepID=UPI00068E0630|nr:hypothetical protein [Mycolicibacterium neoaurum]QVI26526.1 hypothetical protein MN2019_19855 [Mycolicibacterium neoaurum]SDF13141.1 hypothetical protein SAMN04488581_5392 [Mycolicibacterium neoaurum]
MDLKVDAELLNAAGERLLAAAQSLPDAPEPFTPSLGSDALSQALAADIPKAEAPIIEGLPPLKTAATGTAESVIEAARRYGQGDAHLKSKIEEAITPSAAGAPGAGGGAAGGAAAAGAAGAAVPASAAGAAGAAGASGAGGMGQMGGMLGMPMQMAQQAAQIPQQVGGMVASLPQSAMQGAQQVGEQVQQIVEQFSDKESKDGESKPEERSEAGERGERAPVDKPSRAAEDNATINL